MVNLWINAENMKQKSRIASSRGGLIDQIENLFPQMETKSWENILILIKCFFQSYL